MPIVENPTKTKNSAPKGGGDSVREEGEDGEVAEGMEEGEGGAGELGGLVPLNVEAVAKLCVNSNGRVSVIRLRYAAA